MLRDVRPGMTSRQLAQVWSRAVPMVTGLALARWLSRHGVLERCATPRPLPPDRDAWAVSRRRRLLGELKRRKVLKVAATDAVIAFVTLQVAALMVVPLGLPSFTMVLVITLLALGFPATLALTLAFALTDEGLVAAPGVRPRIDNELHERAALAVPSERVTAPAPERSIAVLPGIPLTRPRASAHATASVIAPRARGRIASAAATNSQRWCRTRSTVESPSRD